MDANLAGQGSSALMSGAYFVDGKQHLDYDTEQNHLVPHTTSDLLYKGALKDEARTVWQGNIHVYPGAQRTDAYQASRNLSLSNSARADSIPGWRSKLTMCAAPTARPSARSIRKKYST